MNPIVEALVAALEEQIYFWEHCGCIVRIHDVVDSNKPDDATAPLATIAICEAREAIKAARNGVQTKFL